MKVTLIRQLYVEGGCCADDPGNGVSRLMSCSEEGN